MSEDIMYGCINEDEFSLHSPRMIDGDECNSIDKAFQQALDMIREEGIEQVAICRCKYYGEDGNGWWGEIVGEGLITVNAYTAEWVKEEEEEEA